MSTKNKPYRSTKDLISYLPDELIESILLKLPLRDAARTCILSDRWRYCFAKLPQLFFDYGFWEELIPKREGKVKFAKIISQILLLHQGSITFFQLVIPQNRSSPEIDSFIGFILRQGVKRFAIRMELDEDYKLPSSLFNYPNFIEIDLRGCKINFISSKFRGFRLLTTLTLMGVVISVEALQTVISGSPSLKWLCLQVSIDILDLEFNAPNLESFFYSYLMDTEYSMLPVNNVPKQTICEIFDGLPFIHGLYFNAHCLKSLVTDGVPMILPTPLLHLVSIILDLRLEVEGMLSCVLCLIRSSPILEKIVIWVYQSKGVTGNMQEFEDNSHLACNCLTEVTVENIVGTRTEMELIKLFLAKSSALKNLSIKLATDKADKNEKIMNELYQFQKASSDVKINIID